MKSSDQKQLELVYEQMISQRFMLLDKEKKYFVKISQILSHFIVYKQNQLKTYALKFKNLKTFSNFDQMLWAENIPCFFDKIDMSDQEDDINIMYSDMITYHVMDRIEVKCKSAKETPLIIFKDLNGNVVNTVEITDKQKLKDALMLIFIRTLEKCYNDSMKITGIKTQSVWYKWRAEQLKFQLLRNKIPELEEVL